MAPSRKVYDRTSTSMIDGLANGFRGRLREVLSPATLNQALGFMRTAMPSLSFGVSRVLGAVTRDTLTEGVRSTGTMMSRVLQSSTPLTDVTVMGRLVLARQAQLSQLRARSAETTVGNIGVAMSHALQHLPMQKASIGDLVNTAGESLDREWWRVERVVRTETSFAYNQAQADAMVVLSEDPVFRGKVYSRWCERITDLTGAPMDKKVGKDSIALHGQLARAGASFVMPQGADVNSKMIGMRWEHPPNRPNDRAVLCPWQADWGIPGWIIRAGRRVSL